MVDTRLQYWRTALDEALPFRGFHEDKDALFAHIKARTADNLLALHARQQKLTRQASKRIVEEAGLPLEIKRAFVDALAPPLCRARRGCGAPRGLTQRTLPGQW